MHPTPHPSTTSQACATSGRARLDRHFVQVHAALFCGHADVSDGAKLTYLTLLSFDYLDTKTGMYKGLVFPSIETLCRLRHKSRSTMYAHLMELEHHGLITVLPGVGYRLYNVKHDDDSAGQGCDAPGPQIAAEEPYSAPENHSRRSYPPADTPPPSVRKSGRLWNEEEEKKNNNRERCMPPAQEQGNMAEHGLAVAALCTLGFDRQLARRFVQRYGLYRVQRQLTNLHVAQQQGSTIRSTARWLYRAIECDYATADAGDNRPHPQLHYREEFYTDAQGETRIVLIEEPASMQCTAG